MWIEKLVEVVMWIEKYVKFEWEKLWSSNGKLGMIICNWSLNELRMTTTVKD
jgi:hypothetical protein